MAGIQIDGVNNKIDFDDDQDTSISANTDDTLVIEAGGNTMATITATTFTINDGVIISTADVNPQLTIISTEAGGDQAPLIDLYRNSSSPADGDALGQINYYAENSAGEKINYGRIRAAIADVTDGDEAMNFDIQTMVAGSMVGRMNIIETDTVFNENSADIDFRVESNGATHMLFVDGGNNSVFVNTDNSAGHISGASFAVAGNTTLFQDGNSDNLTLLTTDADANVGPNLVFYRNSGSPADNDDLGKIVFNGRNDNSQDVVYAQIRSTIVDASDGTEDGLVKHDVSLGGTAYQHLSMGNGSIVFNEESQDIDFRVESNGNTHQFFVDAGTDNTMIGTSVNIDRWFNSAPGHSTIFQTSGFNDANRVNAFTHHSNDSGGAMVMLGKSRGGAVGYTVVAENDGIGQMSFQGADGTDMVEAAKILAAVDAAPGANDMPGRLVFFTTADGAASSTERFRIANNGDLTATDTSIGSNSDSRLKENIADYTYDISKFKQFEAKTFDWKNPGEHNGKTGNRGFIAQEVAAIDDYWTDQISIDPDKEDAKLITADSNGNHNAYTLKLGKKDAMYISVIQQLINRIEALEG